jgi:hypothetical protein
LQPDAQGLAGQCWSCRNEQTERQENFEHSRRFRAIGVRCEAQSIAGSRIASNPGILA